MKTRSLLSVLTLCLLLVLASCSSDDAPADVDIGTWSLTVEGVEGVTAFTSEEAKALGATIEVEMTITNSNDESTTSTFTGITLNSLLESIGVTEVGGVTVEAADGFAVAYPADLAMAEDTILAWFVDGVAFEGEPPLRMCPNQGTGNQFVKNAAKIIVEPVA